MHVWGMQRGGHPWLVICAGTYRAGPGALRLSSVSLCLHSILQDVTLTPISLCLSEDHPHSPARTISSLLRTGLHFPKCVVWGTRDGILGEKFFLLIVN